MKVGSADECTSRQDSASELQAEDENGRAKVGTSEADVAGRQARWAPLLARDLWGRLNRPLDIEPMAVAPKIWRRETLVDVCFLFATLTFVLVVVVRLHGTLRVPFEYTGDGLFFGANVKTIIETGWVQETPRLGAPVGQSLYDFPVGGDNGNYLIMRLMAFGTSDWALLINLFFLFSFYSTTLTAYFSFRWLRCGRISAVVSSIIFGLAPFHFIRLPHLVLSHYAVIPLGIVLAFRAASGESFGPNVHRFGWAGWLVACIAVGSFNSYWAIFGVLSIFFVTVLSAMAYRTLRPVLHGAAFSAVIGVSMVANLAGTLAYQARNGPNPTVGKRVPVEIDVYALRLIQMITPIPRGRLWFLRSTSETLSQGYSSEASQYLGVVGAGCLIAMLGWLLVGMVRGRLGGPSSAARSLLAVGAVVWILVASAGGLDWTFLLIGFNRIRGWNRASVIIMFMALAWASLTIPPILARLSARRRLPSYIVPLSVGLLVLLVGLYDQTSASIMPVPGKYAAVYDSDRTFFVGIEDDLPVGASVAQLPVRRFPETESTEQSVDYDLLVPYLHTKRLKWSYGGMKGRESEWQQQLTGLDGVDLVRALSATGFSAVVVDRYGYADRGSSLEVSLREVLGRSPRVSPNGRFSYFSLLGWQNAHARQDSLVALRERLLGGPFVSPVACSPFEGTGDELFTWCPASGEFDILTPEPKSSNRVEFQMSAPGGKGSVTLDVDGREATYEVGPDGTTIQIDVGQRKDARVKFTADVPAVDAPQDERDLRFRISDIRIRPGRPTRGEAPD